MSYQSGASQFRSLFEVALEDYRKQTGTRLVDHPLHAKLIKCDSIESITAILQEQAQAFSKFRGDDGKVMKSLKSAVHVLHSLSTSTLLGEAIGLVRPKALKHAPGS
jgi:fungal STAND N-terminal Goodbye domain